MRVLVMLVVAVLSWGCGGGKDDGWDFGDEPIVIWTIPRPGEEPEETPQPGNGEVGPEGPDDVVPPDGPGLEPTQPSVSPVACGTEYRSVTAPGTIEGTLRRGRGEVAEVPCADAPGAEQRFHIDIPRPMGVEIWMTYRETAFPPVLLLQAGCGDETADLYCSSPIGSHPESYSAHIRAQLEPGRYTLIVDERNLLDFGEGGAFVVHVDEVELGYNAMCEDAESLYPDNIGGVFVPDQGSTGDLRSCFATSSSRHFWKMAVAPRSANRVVAEYDTDDPNVTDGPYIQVSRGCFETCDNVYGSGSVSVANDSDEYIEVIVAVTDSRGLPYRVYQSEMAPLSPNRVCEMAEPVSAGHTVRADLMTGGSRSPFCGRDDSRQLFYEVEVPPGHQLIPEVDDAQVGLSLGCGAQTCVERAVNDTAVTQTYTVAMANWWDSEGEFELTPHVVALAVNASCGGATPVNPAGQPVQGTFTSGGAPGGGCGLVHALGYTLWYVVEVDPMKTVRVEVEPEEEFAPIGLEAMVGACDGSCVGSHDPYLRGPGTAVVELTNDDPSPKVVWLAVTSETPGPQPQRFEIRATEL